MPLQLGRRVTFTTPVSSNHTQILSAYYDYFNASSDPNWAIKPGVVVPPIISVTGDTGFVLVDTATGLINIAIVDHNGIGGLMVDGTAITTADDVMVGIDPSGGITDLTIAGFTVGPRWSGWTPNAEGGSYTTLAGIAKASSGADWLFIRTKLAASGEYTGGLIAGKAPPLTSGLSGGYLVGSGTWTDWALAGTSEHMYYESYEGTWVLARCLPGNATGLFGDRATDGLGAYRRSPVTIALYNVATNFPSFYDWTPVATLPCMFTSSVGTLANPWRDTGGNVVGVNITGDAWVALDDGTDPE